ncbi:hypothetical protein [Sphingomonas gellani]|uniref:hypothetical protein n=1 Tax=Sphingomonas gellani TaxID=1166340 RepID=UPI0011132FCE|nr:hypothetical protein [Sphingomonas gellani]
MTTSRAMPAGPAAVSAGSAGAVAKSVAAWAAIGLALGVVVPWPVLGAALGGGFGYLRAKKQA